MQPCASSSKMMVASSRDSAEPPTSSLHINAAEAKLGRLAQRLDRKCLVLVPFARMRHHLVARELPRGGLKGALIFGEIEIHADLSDNSGP